MRTAINGNANGGKSVVRVLLVEDSPVELAIIQKSLAREPGIEIVGTASNGAEALPLVDRLRPDVICTDYHMPIMDGLEFTERVMSEFPRPILILSISAQPSQVSNILRMIELGAIDVMAKPLANQGGLINLDGKRLAEKIRILSGVHCIPLHTNRSGAIGRDRVSGGSPAQNGQFVPGIICIGSSTGGPQSLSRILPQLPKNYPVPIVCVQHISAGFLHGMVEWLAAKCALKLVIAVAGERPEAGKVYFAPEGKKLRLTREGIFELLEATPTDIYLPSIDALFSSASLCYNSGTVGVILSGMGSDGVHGMQDIKARGGKTFVQDQSSSVIFGMPGAVIGAGAAEDVLPVDLIAPALIKLASN